LVEVATDVVVAEFVAHRPFGQRASEYEFIVHEQIIGNTADTIFVYVVYEEQSHVFADPAFQFTVGTLYLLPLIQINNIYASFHYDGYMLERDLLLNLDDPSRSTLYNQPLSLFSNIDFTSSNITREYIISYVRMLPRFPFYTIDSIFITTDYLRDIINGSPYVLVVEITEPVRMSSAQPHTDIVATDIYLTTVVEVLKGNLQIGDIVQVVFFADTVLPGETHIVSVTPTSTSSYFQMFTSRNSLHDLEQRDEIAAIIRGPNRRPPANNPGPWQSSDEDPPASSPTPTPASSPTPTPASSPTPSANPLRFTASLNTPDTAVNIALTNIEAALPADFVAAMQQRDNLNTLFLQEEMHNITVPTASTQSIISVYIADLDLTGEQLLMLRGFTIDPATGDYTIIPGHFSADRSRFYFNFTGAGIIGALIYEMPTPLLRLNINQYRYYYRGTPQTSDAAPFIIQNRTMVPIRLVSEALGATPRWDGATRTAYIYYNDTTLSLPVGQQLPGNMGTPVLQNNRVLVPLRFVIENFDAITLWDGANREVTVYVLN